jgi:hypothetical protein
MMATPAQPSVSVVDLRSSGLLWLINRAVFHPRGFALAIDSKTGVFSLLGDGSEEFTFTPDDDAAGFKASAITLYFTSLNNKPKTSDSFPDTVSDAF